MPLAAAVAGAAVFGGAVSISANNKAAKAAKQTAAANNALQTQIYNQNKATLGPYVGAGTSATEAITGLLGLDGDATAQRAAFDAYKGATGYDFRLNEGQKAVTTSLGARGLLDSGAAQKALLEYGQNTASGEFGNYLGYLTGQQDVGFRAAGQQTSLGQSYANAVSGNNTNAANVQANAYVSNGAAINGVLGSLVGAFGMSQGMGSSYGAARQQNAHGILGSTGIY